MSALKTQNTLNEIERNMTELAPYRPPELFKEFLVQGYTAITLSSVSSDDFQDLLRAKLCMGTLITLYDDYADRPSQYDPELLEDLYQLNFGRYDTVRCMNLTNRHVLSFSSSLFKEMNSVLQGLPHYKHLIEIISFDLMQFYSANRYSSLVTANPHLGNQLENRSYAHHNMGMVIVSMMDLMASKSLKVSELGAIREVLLMGQRMGRIFNVLATSKREAIDGDVTGELATCRTEYEIENGERSLRQEILDLQNRIASYDDRITTFSVEAYLDGLAKVQRLHKKMEGTI
ncbi:hypothetical protein [Bdellovibrio sp. HCB337]|uniref:hypothetical protein n=1 Tax=Bdellovibrio sp. HCB337 TaxID=3394358 RepID=UPI0039A566A1